MPAGLLLAEPSEELNVKVRQFCILILIHAWDIPIKQSPMTGKMLCKCEEYQFTLKCLHTWVSCLNSEPVSLASRAGLSSLPSLLVRDLSFSRLSLSRSFSLKSLSFSQSGTGIGALISSTCSLVSEFFTLIFSSNSCNFLAAACSQYKITNHCIQTKFLQLISSHSHFIGSNYEYTRLSVIRLVC